MDIRSVLKFFGNFLAGPAGAIKDNADLAGGFDNVFSSLVNKYSGAGPTGAEIYQNEFNANEAQKTRNWQTTMSNTQYQRGVEDAKAAGINPALLYGSGQPSPTPSGATASAAGYSPGGLGELMQLMMLPAQIQNIKAQTEATKAGAALTRQKTLTEEQVTRIQTITAGFQYELTSTEIEKLVAEIGNITADSDLKVSQKDLVDSQSDAQWITNKYLGRKYEAEIQKLIAEKDKINADEKLAAAQEFFTMVQASYADANGFLMSSNDMLLVATYLCDLIGVSKSDVKSVISQAREIADKPRKAVERAATKLDDRIKRGFKNGGSR